MAIRRIDKNLGLLLQALVALYFILSVYSKIFVFVKSLYFVLIPIAVVAYFLLNKKKYFQIEKSSLFIVGLFAFQSFYILLGLLKNGRIDYSMLVSRYLIMFLVFPVLCYLSKFNRDENLVKIFSWAILIKFCVFSFLALGANLDVGFFLNIFKFLREHTDLVAIKHGTFRRIWDSFAIFFPFLLLFVDKKHKLKSLLIHLILLINIVLARSISMFVSYFVICFFFHVRIIAKNKFIILLILGVIAFLLYHEIGNFLAYKNTSISIKATQYDFLKKNISFWGYGVGYEFTLRGSDPLVENLYIYWLFTYGCLGSFIFFFFIIVYPLTIIYNNRKNKVFFCLGLTYLSIVINSGSNPYFTSGTCVLILLMIIAHDFVKKDCKKRLENV